MDSAYSDIPLSNTELEIFARPSLALIYLEFSVFSSGMVTSSSVSFDGLREFNYINQCHLHEGFQECPEAEMT